MPSCRRTDKIWKVFFTLKDEIFTKRQRTTNNMFVIKTKVDAYLRLKAIVFNNIIQEIVHVWRFKLWKTLTLIGGLCCANFINPDLHCSPCES
jgi:hypothetical protein